MRSRLLVAILVAGTAMLAAPALAHGPHVRWHVGIGWGYPWGYPWGWGPGWYGPSTVRVVVPGEAPNLAVVDTDVEPEDARVYLNGQLIGTADDFDGYPDYLYLEPGHYTLEFKLPGYQSSASEIDAQAGRYFPITTKLARNPAERVPAWWEHPEGLPMARVFGPAKTGKEGQVEARPDPLLRPELRGEAATPEDRHESKAARIRNGAALELHVTPANASVYLDGEFLGTGEELAKLERGVGVPAGRHTIEVLAPGKSQKSIDVEVGEGDTRHVVIELE